MLQIKSDSIPQISYFILYFVRCVLHFAFCRIDFEGPAPHHHQSWSRGPTYRRCQEKWKAEAAAKVADDKAVKASVPDNEDVVAAVEACEDKNQGEKVVEDGTKTTEKAEFNCELFGFKSTWQNGLWIHMTRKHSQLEKLDGYISDNTDNEDKKYAETEKYWKTWILSTIFQSYLDANKIVDRSDLTENEKGKNTGS